MAANWPGTGRQPLTFPNMAVSAQARAFAVQRHGAQYSDEPYVVHLDAVVRLLKEHGIDDESVLAAAFLHDTVEDTPVTMQEIIEQFGDEVAELVYWLSDAETRNRKSRMKMVTWRLALAPWNAKLIKLADIIDNTRNIAEHDPDFAPVFMREKRAVLAAMVQIEGDKITNHALYQQAAAHGVT